MHFATYLPQVGLLLIIYWFDEMSMKLKMLQGIFKTHVAIKVRYHTCHCPIIHLLEETDEKEENRNALCEKLKRSKIARMMTTMRSSTGPSYIVRVRETLDDLTVLSTRILTMTPVGQATSSQKLHPTCILPWNTGSLQNAVHGYFNQPPDIPLEAKDDIIGVSLTFFNIERVSGIKVIPTDNLLDHLLLVDEDRKLCVFHHASFVKQMLATQRYVT